MSIKFQIRDSHGFGFKISLDLKTLAVVSFWKLSMYGDALSFWFPMEYLSV